MFYCALSHRVRMLDFLPKEIAICEVGVFEGLFSQRLMERVRPGQLHLVDPWIYHEDSLYKRDTANSLQEEQNNRYQQVVEKFSEEIQSGRIIVHRCTGAEAVKILPDNYFDFIYIDAMHYQDAVRSDLEQFLPKLKHDGIIAGHDFAQHPLSRRKSFGVIPAVTDFLSDNEDLNLFCMTSERWPSYFIGRRTSKMVREFISNLHESNVQCVILPDELVKFTQQVLVPGEKTEKVIPRFCK